jgi:gamma-glutamyltranspeptidase/glutathione hydrolase
MRPRGIVAAGHPETAGVAAAILGEGGNAVDAALAAMCAATVVEPALCSLGGGGFLMVLPAAGAEAGRPAVFDFFAQTPLARRPDTAVDFYPIHADFGAVRQEFHIGLGAIATPGVVKGLFAAHRHFGRLPLTALVAPAVALARQGVPVSGMQAGIITIIAAILSATPSARALFASPARPAELIGEGEVLCLPGLADVLETLAIEGEDLFYRGEIGQRLVRDCAAHGGHLTLADLKEYRCEVRRPLVREAFGARVLLNPPPSTGGLLVAFALGLIEALRPQELGVGSGACLKALAEVMRVANRARIERALHTQPPENQAEAMLAPDLLARYRAEILGRPAVVRGTTHVSVIDRFGTAASLSISSGEGSAYVIPGTDIMLNNMLGEEDLAPEGLQRWPVNTRLGSMMAPTVAQAPGGDVIALGSGGANRIRSAILQVLLNLLAFRMSVADAVAAPRLHVEGDAVAIEPGHAEGAVAALAAAFPETQRWDEKSMFFGGVHAVRRRRDGSVEGVGDDRRGGAVAFA